MEIIDFTIPLYDGLKMLPNFPACAIKKFLSHQESKERYSPPCQGCQVNIISVVDHLGTHVDAPIHFLPDGEDIAHLAVDSYMCRAKVVDLSDKEDSVAIGRKMLETACEKAQVNAQNDEILLLRCTKTTWEQPGYLQVKTLAEDAADFIVEKGFKAVGIDCMAVDCLEDMRRPVHLKLLSHRVLIIEGLQNLEQVPPTGCQFIALPLKIQGGSGSPVRAIGVI